MSPRRASRTPFDSSTRVEELAQAWGREPAGSYSATADRGGSDFCLPARAVLHEGWFADTAPGFAAGLDAPLAFVHVDCDLYSSAKDALDAVGHLLRPGAVVVVDDFLAHETWLDDEKRAWDEARERFGLRAEVICASLLTKQVAFRILDK